MWVTSWNNLFFRLYAPLGRTLWEYHCSFQNIRKTWKPGDYQQMLDICRTIEGSVLNNPEKTEVWLGSFTKNILWDSSNFVCNQIKFVKFVKISRPDPRDPDFNREESNQGSPRHPHETDTNGALTTLWKVLGPPLKSDKSYRPRTGVQESGGGGVMLEECSILPGD